MTRERLTAPPSSGSDLKRFDRVTVSFNLVYQHDGDAPHQVMSIYDQLIPRGDDEVYTRRRKAVEGAWDRLDTGWVSSVLIFSVQSLVGNHLAVNPTLEEREKELNKILAVSYSKTLDEAFLIPPRGLLFFYPSSSPLFITSLQGEANYRLTVIPKSNGQVSN